MTPSQKAALSREADKVMEKLTKKQIRYARAWKRGRNRGFEALRDVMDADDLLGYYHWRRIPFMNSVKEEVTRRIVDEDPKSRPG